MSRNDYDDPEAWTSVKSVLIVVAALAAYVLLFALYGNTVIARPHVTVYTNFFWGVLHGFFAVPSFVIGLSTDSVAIYQTPNSGSWYDFGFLIGIFGSAKGLVQITIR